MAVLNFPASPALNDTYTENDVRYTWTGSYWAANNATVLADEFVNITGDQMTGSLELTNGGETTINLDHTTGDVSLASINGSVIGGRRQLFLNGECSFNSRLHPEDTIPDGYGLDLMFHTSSSGGAKRVAGFGPFKYAIQCKTVCQVRLAIELPDAKPGMWEAGQPFTFSYWTKGTAISNTGTYSRVSMVDTADQSVLNNDLATPTGAVNGDWVQYSKSFNLSTRPPENHQWLVQYLYGPDATTVVTGMQFEPGLRATPYEFLDIALQEQMLARYYQNISSFQEYQKGQLIYKSDINWIPFELNSPMAGKAVMRFRGGSYTIGVAGGNALPNPSKVDHFWSGDRPTTLQCRAVFGTIPSCAGVDAMAFTAEIPY